MGEGVRLIEGMMAVDDRREVSFVNEFNLESVRRCFLVSNNRASFVRAWHAQRREGKYVMVVRGAALVGAVPVDDWETPSKETPISRHVLSERRSAVLYIPPGYANRVMPLTADARVLFFSTASIAESQRDDVRYDARYWDIWDVVER